ncbi:hypothetical protein JG688_00014661 [Phytophthora aleatoria]|uniref:Uncharacterized protein n=1 Tax=Phytophthora aleatoria TaxID=2496075 RepID=A0A8J5LXE6_9STRA|nr:hypothetical protein JG688_00014661 [Phytophthora aleatoria]
MNQFLGMTSEWLAEVFITDEATMLTYNAVSETHWQVADDPVLVHSCEREKYRCAQDVCGRITAEISDLPVKTFRCALDYLERWCKKLRQGDLSTAIWSDENNNDEEKNLPATQKADELEEKNQKQHGDSNPSEKRPEPTASSGPAIKPFNPRRRVGRPRKDKAAANAKESRERKEYNKGSKLRNAVRGDDVASVEEFLKARQQPLIDLSSFHNTFEVRSGRDL